jgi:UDP-N-acetyl-D-mannosaminuronate dehydrogenase
MSLPFPRIRLTVIGTGYLGLTHAVCMAELGHDVLAIDVDPAKVAKAASGEPPFFEPVGTAGHEGARHQGEVADAIIAACT